jgi:glutamyl-Q tRNA(Asp) synthetase
VLQQLGLPVPRYAHLPVAVDERGEKLSKQTHAAPIDASRGAAVLCAALRFLGQAPPAQLERARASGVLQWAISHWRRAAVPREASRRYSPER